MSTKLDETPARVVVEKLTDLPKFYDSAAASIRTGKLDTQILEMRQAKSGKLTGKTDGKRVGDVTGAT